VSKYNEETKAAVMASLLSGQSVTAVAKEYDIPRGTIAGWSAQANSELANVSNEKKAEIGDLLIEYLRANLEALKKQVLVFSDAAWLREQSASEAAVLHGVMADKSMRLLEAFGRNDSNSDAAN
jgi:transposase-like protein